MSEDKSYLDSFTKSGKPEGFEAETFVAVKNKSRNIKIIAAIITVVVLLVGSFVVFNKMNHVEVPALVGMTLDEASVWATQNKIILASKSSYNFDIDADTVISQATQAGESIKKQSSLTIEVSLGADPSEKITWPDIKTMTKSEIETWISDNKLTGINIATANSDVVEADKVISYTLTDNTEENFTRKSRATVNISLGAADASETVVVEDFSSMKAGEVLQWGADNDVAIVISEAFDDYVSAGNVISQSIKATTEINKTEPITVVVSKGEPIVVANFSSMSEDDANAWAKLNNVTLIIKEKYSSNNDKGKLFSQSIAAGSTIEGSDELKLTYSLGPVDVASYVDKSKLDILNWQKEANTKGANITLTFSSMYGTSGSSGKIVSQSIKNEYVMPGTSIDVVISLGMKVVTPDFSELTETGCSELAKSSGVTVVFNYQSSSTVSKGLVISQSPAKDTVITDAEPITIAISLTGTSEAVTVPNFKAMSKDEADTWASTNNITLYYVNSYRDNDAKGSLYNQSIASGKSIAKSSGITVYYSLGKSATVPDFAPMTKEEANSWAKTNNVSLTYVEKYRNSETKGSLYSQSISSGETIAQGTDITVYCSLGQVEIASFVGKSKLDMLNWMTDVNSKGANLSAVYTYAGDTAKDMNMIVGQSVMNTNVSTGTAITFNISWA